MRHLYKMSQHCMVSCAPSPVADVKIFEATKALQYFHICPSHRRRVLQHQLLELVSGSQQWLQVRQCMVALQVKLHQLCERRMGGS